MKKILQFVSILFLLAGCAYNTRVDYAPQAVNLPKSENISRVLILPFSDFRNLGYQEWLQYNLVLYEAMSQAFLKHGYLSVPYEEIISTLQQDGWIDYSPPKIKISKALLEVSQEDWSSLMKQEIAQMIERDIRHQTINQQKLPPIINVSDNEILSLGQKFGVTYVIRGRISELNIRREDTFNPFKLGFLTASNKALSRLVYGAAEDNDYATWQEVSIGALVWGAIGSNAKDPFEPPHKRTVHVGHPLFGETYTEHHGGNEDYDINNALVWGTAGALLSFLASHGGYSPEAVIGLSVDVYDISKGEIIWHNRIRLRVAPQSVWAPRHPQDLLLSAIEEAVQSLVEQFWLDTGQTQYAGLY